jgi:hypothetical protein
MAGMENILENKESLVVDRIEIWKDGSINPTMRD